MKENYVIVIIPDATCIWLKYQNRISFIELNQIKEVENS
jgi:hypothetical protein